MVDLGAGREWEMRLTGHHHPARDSYFQNPCLGAGWALCAHCLVSSSTQQTPLPGDMPLVSQGSDLVTHSPQSWKPPPWGPQAPPTPTVLMGADTVRRQRAGHGALALMQRCPPAPDLG